MRYVQLVALCTLLAIGGCSSSRIAVQPAFWKMTNRSVGIALGTWPKAAAYRMGSQGLLDVAINEAASSSLESHLETLQPEAFADVVDTFATRLQALGFTVKKIGRVIDVESLPKMKTQSEEPDFRSLRQQEGVEFLVLLSIDHWGTARNYYGFLPLEHPKGMCMGRGILVELITNTQAWLGTMGIDDARVDVAMPWDEPPDYPNVTVAVDRAIGQAKRFLVHDFFETTPAQAAK